MTDSCNVCGDEGAHCVPFASCSNYPGHEAGGNMLDPSCDGCGIRQSQANPHDLDLWVTVTPRPARSTHVELCADCACTDRSENL